ncbi:hypothetical protein E1263_38475 [Kribbella antibiotica]|uniref:Ribbon-helix-helix protein, CopG family n=1 Tax=Kribbella antibiotica TaxID=190195 RepID=A0A4R4YKM6_9ACTN|nr:hypothetical protein [Kribbella antibiotica]TDD45501.1 hypothetical protein E1263_38475 [Kribbella antibiotica]
MADMISIRVDAEIERALDVLTRDGRSRAVVIQEAVLAAALRVERASDRRREVLRMPLGEVDGVDVGVEICRDR